MTSLHERFARLPRGDVRGVEIVVATFDQQLWDAAKRTGLKVWPADILRPETR